MMPALPRGPLPRRRSRCVRVGRVAIGGDSPIVVQSMTNTDTVDDFATAMQVAQLARAGSEIVRITVNNREAAAAVPKIRDRLAAMQGGTIAIGFAANPQEPQAVRGGPMFEFLFGIDTQLRREGRRERFQLVFFNPSQEPGARLGAKTVQGLLAEMARRGIATHLGHKMLRFEPGKVVTEGGEIAADLILFMPGMTGNAWFDATTLPRSPGGLLRADAQCRIEGWQHCYVVGDSGSFPGPEWAPKQAHMAELHAKAAAANLLDALAGRPEQAGFVPQLACIIDSGSHGTLVLRSPQRTLVLPPLRLMHWAKRRFEARYLGQYR